MKRDVLLSHLRVAGYHDDSATFTRLYIENRISYDSAKKEYLKGQKMKADGIGCTCPDCKTKNK